MMPVTPSVGRNLSLVCVVSVAGQLNPNPHRLHRWIRAGTDELLQTGQILTFSPLTLNDAQEYICEATVTSGVVGLNLTRSASHIINIASKSAVYVHMHRFYMYCNL